MIARDIDSENPEGLSYHAATLAAKIREDLILQGVSFCFETVFSHESKIDFLAQAKANGYEIILVYVHLFDASLNEARVKQRVSEGGHNDERQTHTQIRVCLSFVPSDFKIPPVEFRRIFSGYSCKNLIMGIEISIQLPKVSLTKFY